MSESKNTKVEKDGTVKDEKKTTPEAAKKTEPVKAAPTPKAPDNSKSDRLDRMEEQLNLIEDGILVLINSTQWHNLSITPIGSHNPESVIDGYLNLVDAVEALQHADEDTKIKQ